MLRLLIKFEVEVEVEWVKIFEPRLWYVLKPGLKIKNLSPGLRARAWARSSSTISMHQPHNAVRSQRRYKILPIPRWAFTVYDMLFYLRFRPSRFWVISLFIKKLLLFLFIWLWIQLITNLMSRKIANLQ